MYIFLISLADRSLKYMNNIIKMLLFKKLPYPPTNLLDMVGQNDLKMHKEIGNSFLSFFKTLSNLQSKETVLDIGCGCGRMAIPLTGYLTDGSYYGFDIQKPCIDWCADNITPKYPNFHFDHVDVYNSQYNPAGKLTGSNFAFPYPDNMFDFIFLTSVFTHMVPSDVSHYLYEIKRVMKDKGRCLSTFFILTEKSKQLIQNKKAFVKELHRKKNYHVSNQSDKDLVVFYEEEHLLDLLINNGFSVYGINYGLWSGAKNGVTFQDVVLFDRA